jgi:tight adherence protein B
VIGNFLPIALLLKWLSVLFVGVGLFFGTWSAVSDVGGPVNRLTLRYIAWLERQLRLMFILVPGKYILIGQGAAFFLVPIVALILELPYYALLFAMVLVFVGPAAWISKKRKERLEAIELQLDGFILALANALKSTPSIGAAMISTVAIIEEPMRSEVDHITKEMKVGSTLEQALLQMALRIGSRSVDTALSAVLIGKQVGGNLPKVLESTAISLREMQRLEGYIRSKTADSRMQLWVIGAMPAIVVLGLNWVQPGYFTPMMESVIGYVILIAILICWSSAILVARKVLAVDI